MAKSFNRKMRACMAAKRAAEEMFNLDLAYVIMPENKIHSGAAFNKAEVDALDDNAKIGICYNNFNGLILEKEMSKKDLIKSHEEYESHLDDQLFCSFVTNVLLQSKTAQYFCYLND